MITLPAITILLLTTVLQAAPASQVAELERVVTEYWNALEKHDKAAALRFVHPDDVNDFINRKGILFLDWEVEKTEWASNHAATVTVRLDQVINANRMKVPMQERWEETEAGWKVRVTPFEEAHQKTLQAFRNLNTRLPAGLTFVPKQLRIYEMAQPKVGSIVIRNGLESAAQIVSFDIDTSKFQVLALPEEVSPGTTARVRVAFIGEETDQNLRSEAVLEMRLNGQQEKISIPVIYNYADQVTEWLSRKAPEKMKDFKTPPPTPQPPPGP